MRHVGLLLGVGLVLTAAFAACTSSSGAGGAGQQCTPGDEVEGCFCSSTVTGVQVCAANGAFGPCVCPDASAGGGGTGGSGGAGGNLGNDDAGPEGGADAGGSDADSSDADSSDADAASPPGTPVVLVPNLAGVSDLVLYPVDSTHSILFWTSQSGGGTVSQYDTNGTSSCMELASAQAFPRGLAVTSGTVVWTVHHTLDADGGPSLGLLRTASAGIPGAATYIGNQVNPDAVVADPNHVFWSVGSGIYQCSLFGCTTPIPLATEAALAIAADASNVYWANATASVSRIPIGGPVSASTSIAAPNATSACGLVLAAGSVIWATTTTVYQCPVTGCADPVSPTPLAQGQSIFAQRHALAADSTHVYWSSAKSILRCAFTGCGGVPELVAAGQTEPTSVAVDATNVYWVDGSTIKKAAKPQ